MAHTALGIRERGAGRRAASASDPAPGVGSRLLGASLMGGWVLVPVAATLMMNQASMRIFEPDRSAALRVLVTVLAGLSLLSSVWRQGVWRGPQPIVELSDIVSWLRARPLVVAVLAFVVAMLASTSLAIDPRRAFFGTSVRGYGTALDLAAILGAFLLTGRVRSADTAWHVLAVVQFGVLGAAVIALAQYVGVTALPTETSLTSRPIGTIGNPLFLGAVMTVGVPLALASSLRGMGGGERAHTDRADAGEAVSIVGRGLAAAGAIVLLIGGLQFSAGHRATPLTALAWPVAIVIALSLWLSAVTAAPAGERGAWRLPALAAIPAVTFSLLSIWLDWVLPPEPIGAAWSVALWSVLTLAVVLAAAGLSWVPAGRVAELWPGAAPLPVHRFGALGWGGVAALEVAALLVSDSRGPVVGATVGVAAFFVAAVVRSREHVPWRRAGAALGVVVVVGFALAALHAGLVRGSGPFDFSTGTGLERRLIWIGDGSGRGVAGVIATAPAWRLLFGHGAESLGLLFERHYPLALGGLLKFAVPDRAHMVPLDVLVHHGVVGLGAWAVCGVVACWQCWRLAAADDARRVLACGLLGGLIGHLVEGLSGIVVVPTLVLWWVMVGLVVSLQHMQAPGAALTAPTWAPVASPRRARSWQRLVLVAGACLLLAGGVAIVPLHLQTVRADMALAHARIVEQQAMSLPAEEGRRVVAAAYVQAASLASHEPIYWRALGDALWRSAARKAGSEDAQAVVRPSVQLLLDPSAAGEFAATANTDELLVAATMAFDAGHRARPELSDPLASAARAELELYGRSGNLSHLTQAIVRYGEATARVPSQVYLLVARADALLELAELELGAGRVLQARVRLREADIALGRAFAIGGNGYVDLDPRVDTLRRLRLEAP